MFGFITPQKRNLLRDFFVFKRLIVKRVIKFRPKQNLFRYRDKYSLSQTIKNRDFSAKECCATIAPR